MPHSNSAHTHRTKDLILTNTEESEPAEVYGHKPPTLGYPGPIAIPLPTLSVVDRPPLVPGQPALDLRDSRGVGPKAAPCRREGGESLRGTGIDAAALDILDKGLRMLRL